MDICRSGAPPARGLEMAITTHKAFGWTGYFGDPFSSWELGSNGVLDELIRQYIPKTTGLMSVTETALALIEEKLYNRRRKRTGVRTNYELFTKNYTALHFVWNTSD